MKAKTFCDVGIALFCLRGKNTLCGGFLPGKALTCLMMEIFTRKGGDDATENPSWISRYQLKYHNFPITVSPLCMCFKYLGNRWERSFDWDTLKSCVLDTFRLQSGKRWP